MKIIINDCSVITRLDKFLKKKYPHLTQGLIERGIRKGHIKVNDTKPKAKLHVKDNDVLIIADYIITCSNQNYIKPEKQIKDNANVRALAHKIINSYKIAETSDYIVVNKPASLATQGGSKILLSLDDALKYLNKFFYYNFKLVHRLDKETTGLLIIAKNDETAIKLSQAFLNHSIKKEYTAILQGIPNQLSGEIITNISKTGYRMAETQNGGKVSITKYQVKAVSINSQLSLVSFIPITGRTHQLRVHAAKIGCPIIGDKKYNNYNTYHDYSLKLHATRICIPKFSNYNNERTYYAPLPNQFQQIKSIFF
ncbi:RNA pseudouridylate synthase family protein [Orientia chuto str. Dubai]|uniref:Ribosomal large subunit pseudouridine synthase C n=1 Tax=Orientia chuto str. Dubai TaxID=1359168 RepID=A0A0F3MLB0_9RICK|nr:RluA family pseudouridine synthase [Candidatus Orientia mediorientalis]KJV56451.1 RNA pseudouridylate synthase family protein [Orientia chuto str. Dubai]